MWDLPEPVIEPVSPALAGEFLSTRSSGKSRSFHGSQSERGNRPRAVKAMKHFTDRSNEILGAGTWVAGWTGLAAPLPWCAPACLRPRASAHSFEAWKARSLVQSWGSHRREHMYREPQAKAGQGQQEPPGQKWIRTGLQLRTLSAFPEAQLWKLKPCYW